ncbi:MAG: LamG domain-containing protein, partial [Planctomycetota bacterium]
MATQIYPTKSILLRGRLITTLLVGITSMLIVETTAAEEVGNWPFDEGSGTSVADISGFNNHGFFVGSPIWTTDLYGSSLYFNGAGARVIIPDAPSLDITEAITIAAWMRPSMTGTQYVIKKARHKSIDGYEMSLSSRGSVFVRFNQVSSGNTYKLLSTSGYPDDGSTWIHVVATYDGQEIKLYVDGLLDSSMFAPGLSIGSNDNSLSIGAQDDEVRPFKGTMNHVHLYNVALSQADIQELFEAESEVDPNEEPLDSDGDGMPDYWELLWGFDPFNASDADEDADGDGVSNLDEYLQGTNPADGPPEEVGNWPFDEGSGTSVADISGFSNHGFFVGSPIWTTDSYGSSLYFDG